MEILTIHTEKAPAAVGPYSQATLSQGLVFCSGQIALDPATGRLIDGDIRAQTVRVCENLAAVLAARGLDLENVVKTTVFLVDMKDFPEVNAVYQEFFKAPYPARSCVQVAALPLGARLEIEAIAVA